MIRSDYLLRKSVQHFDSLSETGPLCLRALTPTFHCIANPFRWNTTKFSQLRKRGNARALLNVTPNGRKGERHEQRRSELVIANNQGPGKRKAFFVGAVRARANFPSVDERCSAGTGLHQPHKDSAVDHGDGALGRALGDGVSICYCLVRAAVCSAEFSRNRIERAVRPSVAGPVVWNAWMMLMDEVGDNDAAVPYVR